MTVSRYKVLEIIPTDKATVKFLRNMMLKDEHVGILSVLKYSLFISLATIGYKYPSCIIRYPSVIAS